MDSYLITAVWFVAGGVVTSVFSGSLVALTQRVDLVTVVAVGMIVPTFTWAVQLIASGLALGDAQRRAYWRDLGVTCLVGSVALLPAAVVNLALQSPPRWVSVANVLGSVTLMGACLLRRTARQGLPIGWPISWCFTICLNMLLFLWSSRGWW